MSNPIKRESVYNAVLRLSESPFAQAITYIVMACASFAAYFLLTEFNILNGAYAEIASIFLGVIAATLCTSSAKAIIEYTTKRLEDSLKLSRDYCRIIAAYPYNSDQFYVHANGTRPPKPTSVTDTWTNPFPEEILYCNGAVVTVCKNAGKDPIGNNDVNAIRFPKNLSLRLDDDPSKTYRLPSFSVTNYPALFESHKHSNVTNAPMLRIADSSILDDEIVLQCERTSFFNSLVTNRALDVEIAPNLTSRAVYNPRRRPISLKESPLSNHLGVHCLIATFDGWHVFIQKRKGSVSIGKQMAGIGVMGSFKLGEDDGNAVTRATVYDRLFHEIECELAIKPNELIGWDDKTDSHLTAFYRDWVEGGKPQLLFSYRCTLTGSEFVNRFAQTTGRSVQECDGESLVFLHENNLPDLEIHPNGFKGPFVSASKLMDIKQGKTTVTETVSEARQHPTWLEAMPSTTVSMALGIASPVAMEILSCKQIDEIPAVVIDSLCRGKYEGTGAPGANQDSIVVTPRFIAVIDGATAKDGVLWNGKKSGLFAADVLGTAIRSLNQNATSMEALIVLKRTLEQECARALERSHISASVRAYPSASVAMYSFARSEVWIMGDCQCMISGSLVTFANPKREQEKRLAIKRAAIDKELIEKGKSVRDILDNDCGRAAILDELIDLENRQSVPSLSGNPEIPAQSPHVVAVPAKSEIVLASDGYPALQATLEESESRLQKILKSDPLLINEYAATKAACPGGSFDDRAYIRFLAKRRNNGFSDER